MNDLKTLLIESAADWCAVQGEAPLSRLGKRVAGDANFFARIEAPEATCNLATVERFARFLGDEANWPQGAVSARAREFVERVAGEPAQVVA